MALQSLASLLVSYRRQHGSNLHLPEYRALEMYSGKRRRLPGEARDDSEPPRLDPALLPYLDGPWSMLHLLEAAFSQQPGVPLEAVESWQRYRSLPRHCLTDKLIAESYRLLRIVRVVLLHPQGHLAGDHECLTLTCHANRYPVQLAITPAGLQLLQSLVCYYLAESQGGQVGEAYLEAMLQGYFTDLIAELRGFEDEDRTLCQFRPGLALNRHWRLDCRNPRYRVENGYCLVQLAPRFADGAVHPIDFYLTLNDAWYRVPMEALSVPPGGDGREPHAIPMGELPRWQIRRPDPLTADIQSPVVTGLVPSTKEF